MSKRKLLLADDSITIQKVVNLTFADEGIEVISVGDGNSAMDKLREDLPDLVMADVNMPGLNGYEICENIKQTENSKEIPVILLVGSFEPFDEDEAKRVGANDYLTKPFQSISQLVDKVSNLLKSNENLAETAEVSANNGGATYLKNDSSPTSPASEESGSDNFNLLEDDFDDEMIQTDQIGSLPVTDSAKFEAGPEKPKIIDDEIIEETSVDQEVSYEQVDLHSDFAIDDQVNREISEPFTEVTEKDFNKTQPLTDEDIQELAIENNDSEKTSEDIQSDSVELNESIVSDISGETSTEEEEDSSENIFEEIEDTNKTDDSDLENVDSDLPMPEVASILELDELNLLDLPPLEEDEQEDGEQSDNESIVESSSTAEKVAVEDYSKTDANVLGEKAASYFADEEEKKRFIETSISGEAVGENNDLNEKVSSELVAQITAKVVERLSERAVREIAWEVVPELAELIIKKLVEEKMKD